jgi:predicted acetyltransferase
MPNLFLCAPDVRFATSYVKALSEGYHLGDDPPLGAEAIAVIAADIPAHLAAATRQGVLHRFPDGTSLPLSPFTLLWLVEDKREFLGSLHLRHVLANDYARLIAGHVRYGIRPSQRGQGFGTELLMLAKVEARALGLRRILLVCREDNTPSRRLIENCGGIFENVVLDPHGAGMKRRYWIDL